MGELLTTVVARAARGETNAVRELVQKLLPVVRARVLRGLRKRRGMGGRGRDFAQEQDDLTQEVFAALFADGARTLKAWDPARGLSMENFVGLVADRQVGAILRTGRRSPWTEEATASEALDCAAGEGPALEAAIGSRQFFDALLARLEAELSPRGLELFVALVIEERDIADVCAAFAISADSAYAWRSRLLRRCRELAATLERVVESPAAAHPRPLSDPGAPQPTPRRGATP
jgi:RNA polymerase sigma-70 factor (ECF subfamily)